MYAPLELFLGLRYLRAKRRNHFISFISLVSMLGVAVGVAALIVVLSVMNGFGNELRARLLSLTAHAMVTLPGSSLAGWEEVRATVERDERVVGAAPLVGGEGMLVNGLRLSGAVIDGVLPAEEPAVSEIGDKMQQGSLDDLLPGERRILLGAVLAYLLGVEVGDRVNLLVPRAPGAGASLVPKLLRFTVSGVFEVGIQEHDAGRALVHLEDAVELFGLREAASGIRLKLADPFLAPLVARDLERELGHGYRVLDWTRQQATYFRAIKIEKLMMFVIMSLIVAVAVFNIVATLVMVVTDKRAEIAILRTMGLGAHSVMGVFMVQGVLIGLVGTLLGVALGVGLAVNVETLVPRLEALLGFKLIPADVYYVTEIPSDPRWGEVITIALTAFGLSALSTLYPARRAAATQPADALRYE